MASLFTTLVYRVVVLVGLLGGLAATARAQAPAWQPVVATTVTGINNTYVAVMASDASGNVYMAGVFSDTLSLGGTTLIGTGYANMFVAKWVPATQSFAWVQQTSSATGRIELNALATSGGSVYVAGYFRDTATFDSSSFTSAGGTDGFVLKLTDTGSSAAFGWAQTMGGSYNDQVFALAVQGTAVYAAGGFSGTATFGSASYTSAGGGDSFLTKLIDAGPSATLAWTRALGSANDDYASSVAVQGSSIYLTGFFTGAMTIGTTNLGGPGRANLYVIKLIDAGTSSSFSWAQGIGCTNSARVRAMVVQGNQLYLAGHYQGSVGFGSTWLPGIQATPGYSNGFVAKLIDTGPSVSFSWSQASVSTFDTHNRALVVQGSSIYLAGSFSSTTTMGGITLTAPSSAIFVARLTDAGPSVSYTWVASASGIGDATALAASGTSIYVGGLFHGQARFGNQLVGLNNSGTNGFFTALPDATGLAATGAALPSTRLALFPTPTPRGTLATVQLAAAAPSAGSSVDLTVLDNLGRVVRTRTVALAAGSQQATLDVAGLAPGVYALRVAVGQRLGTARLVVE
jgi:hypothetical protein